MSMILLTTKTKPFGSKFYLNWEGGHYLVIILLSWKQKNGSKFKFYKVSWQYK